MKDILKKTLSLFLCTLCIPFFSFQNVEAQASLRTNDSVVIKNSYVGSTAVLTDPKGFVYTEFAANTYIVHRKTKGRFSGEILPPTIIEEPPYTKNPRGRMRDIVAFEIASDSLDDLYFIDKFDIAHQRNRERAALLNGGTLERTKLVKVFVPLFQEYGYPALWEYTGEQDNPWIRLGGRKENTKENDIQLFVASLTGTGIYVLFDEDPAPDNADTFIPYEEIQTAPEAPYTSVQPTFNIPKEATAETFVGDDIFGITPNGPVNIPVDQFGNPIEENIDEDPLIGNELNGFGLNQTQLDANRKSLQPLFSGNPTTGTIQSPIPTTSNPLNPPLTQPISSPETTIITPPQEAIITELPIETSSFPTPSTNNISRERVNELIQKRLLQTLPDTTNRIDTTRATSNNVSSALLQAPSTNTEYTDIKSALLNNRIQTQHIPLTDTESLSVPDILISEESLSEENYSSAPEGDLPKTGKNKNNTLWYIFLLGLIGTTGFVFYKKRAPQQMRIKMK